MTLSPEQISALDGPLSRSAVKTRSQSGRNLSYVEGWFVIAEANRIFGFDAWASETIDIKCVSERERRIGRPPNDKPGWGVSYVAKVRVTVGDVVREGVGAGHGIDVDLGLAHESAIKEAETDARKRALMTFGNPFGLALYDKEQREVADDRPAAQERRPAPAQRPQPQLVHSKPDAGVEDRIAYLALARTAINSAEFAGELDQWWRAQADQRAQYGVTKGTDEYAALAELFKAAKSRLPSDLTAAG